MSKWFCVATAGATVDGREITAEVIEEMAISYAQDEYTALIWAEHSRSPNSPSAGKNWGTVDELKAESVAGQKKLFAKITPNQYLINANRDGQKLFTSVEINTNYRGTGKAYLTGLAVTDSPASSGTTRLKFSIGANQVEREYSSFEPMNFSEFDIETEVKYLIDAFRKQMDKLNELEIAFRYSNEAMDDFFAKALSPRDDNRPSGTGTGPTARPSSW